MLIRPASCMLHLGKTVRLSNVRFDCRVKLKAFKKFSNTAEALVAATALVEGKVGPDLQEFLKENASSKETLAIADAKLAASINQKLGYQVITDAATQELMRGLRSQIETLVSGSTDVELKTMSLGLAHSLSRYKLKFSPDKIDTMIVQAIGMGQLFVLFIMFMCICSAVGRLG